MYGDGMSSVTEPEAPSAPPEPPVAYGRPDRLTRFVTGALTRSPVWLAPAAMLACMGAAAGYTLVSHPTDAGAGAAPTCLLKYVTGFDCPGCGGTRAAWYLLPGDVPAEVAWTLGLDAWTSMATRPLGEVRQLALSAQPSRYLAAG